MGPDDRDTLTGRKIVRRRITAVSTPRPAIATQCAGRGNSASDSLAASTRHGSMRVAVAYHANSTPAVANPTTSAMAG